MNDHRIILTRETGLYRVDLDIPAVVAYHRAYRPPLVTGDVLVVPLEELEANPRGVMGDRTTLVMVGLSRAMTPSNRTHELWEILFNATPGWHKVSLDTTLFVGEPWRAWFHWGFVGAPYREYTYSYLAESHWKAHREGTLSVDPFDLETVTRWGRGVVWSDHRRYFDLVEVEIVPVGDDVRERYRAEKVAAFDEETTEAGIVQRLARVARGACPRRSIPTPSRLFDRREWRIVRTDLSVDAYVVGQLLERVCLADDLAAAFHGERS